MAERRREQRRQSSEWQIGRSGAEVDESAEAVAYPKGWGFNEKDREIRGKLGGKNMGRRQATGKEKDEIPR